MIVYPIPLFAYFRHRRVDWQELVLLGLCALVAFPDVILNWIGQRWDIQIPWWAVIPYECVALSAVGVGLHYLSASLPELTLTSAAVYCGTLILLRCVHYGLIRLFSFD